MATSSAAETSTAPVYMRPRSRVPYATTSGNATMMNRGRRSTGEAMAASTAAARP